MGRAFRSIVPSLDLQWLYISLVIGGMMSWRNEKSAKRGSCWMRCLCIPAERGGDGHDGQESIMTDFAEFDDAMPEAGKWD